MAILAFMVSPMFDPVQAGIVLVVLCIYRGAFPIIVAGGVAAVLSDTVIAFAAEGYSWGELFIPRMGASLLQAAILYWAIRIIYQRNPVPTANRGVDA